METHNKTSEKIFARKIVLHTTEWRVRLIGDYVKRFRHIVNNEDEIGEA